LFRRPEDWNGWDTAMIALPLLAAVIVWAQVLL